jgi:cell division cycle protein 20 (cofactor of APC complex)
MLSSLCNVPLSKLDEDGEPTGLLSFRGGILAGSSSSGSNTSTVVSSESERRGGGILLPASSCSATTQDLGSIGGSGCSPTAGRRVENPYAHDLLRTMKLGESSGMNQVEDLSVAKKVLRKVPGAPFRILDAPDIVDDYYLNLISWSKDNVLAVALAQSVYLWNATNGEINHLVTLENPSDYVTSVNWCTMPGSTKYLAVGTNSHSVHMYDGTTLQKARTFGGHTGRVSSLAWNQNWMTSGSRDSTILNHDMRSSESVVATYRGHQQEVCGLKWNEEGSCLASGGNENYLCLWDAAMSGHRSFRDRHNGGGGAGGGGTRLSDSTPRLVLKKHRAAVKALDWCPFHRGLLASGGGTSDRTIKFWSSNSGAMLNSIDTGSQVCSVIWSKHQREICSSHGYSENQLILWKYPTMTRIKELPGHTARVLNMEISPDGASVVSAAADETLRFWNVFGSPSSYRKSSCMLAGDLSFGTPTTIR